MKEKKIIEKIINHPKINIKYNVINRIYFSIKKNKIILTGIVNNHGEVSDLTPIIENIILSYRLIGASQPHVDIIILNIYNKRGKKLSTVTVSC